MIRLTDKMSIFPAVNIINKQRTRNTPISPRKYSSPLLTLYYGVYMRTSVEKVRISEAERVQSVLYSHIRSL